MKKEHNSLFIAKEVFKITKPVQPPLLSTVAG
jgi:hypothetical protein